MDGRSTDFKFLEKIQKDCLDYEQMTMVAVVFTLMTVLSEMLQNLLTETLKKLSMVHAKYYITHHSREMAMKLWHLPMFINKSFVPKAIYFNFLMRFWYKNETAIN